MWEIPQIPNCSGNCGEVLSMFFYTLLFIEHLGVMFVSTPTQL